MYRHATGVSVKLSIALQDLVAGMIMSVMRRYTLEKYYLLTIQPA
jgi:hypothetical protein